MEFGSELTDEVYGLYEENGWTSYLKDRDLIARALDNSMYVLGAFDGGKLIGFVRCVGDGETIVYVQDLIVAPSHLRQGVGRELMRRVSEGYAAVRQLVLITDAEDEVSNAFYRAIGMVQTVNGCGINHYFRKQRND